MKDIIPFVFEDTQIRVIRDDNGEPLFVGKDICEALGYANHNDAMNLHCKGVVKRYPLQTAGGKQNMRVLVEGDMYRLMTHSKLEGAERFESLVFDEILPTIRKTGKYESQPPVNSRPVPAAKLFPDYFKVARLIGCDRNAAAISANQAVLKKTGENVLSLLGHKAIEAEKQSPFFNASELAAGVSGRRMNKMLEAAGLQHNENGRWIPDDDGKYSRIFDTGKHNGSGVPVSQVKWSRDVLSMLKIELAA